MSIVIFWQWNLFKVWPFLPSWQNNCYFWVLRFKTNKQKLHNSFSEESGFTSKGFTSPCPPRTSLHQTWRRDSRQPTLEAARVKVIALHPPGSPVLTKTCALGLGTSMQGLPWAETPLREVGRGEGCSGGQRGRRLEHPFLCQVQGLSSPPFWSFSSPFFHPLIRAPGLDVEVL